MKKFFVTVFFSLFAIIACAFSASADGLVANAAYDLDITVTELSEPEGLYAQAGDLKVTLSISNNDGYATLGAQFRFNAAEYSTYLNGSEEDGTYCVTGPAATGALTVLETDEAGTQIGMGIVMYTDNDVDGDILTFYLTKDVPNPTNDPITGFYVDQMCNDDKQELPYTEPTTYDYNYIVTDYIVGDVDGDGEITEFDAQIVDGVLDANGGTISAADFEDDVPFYEYDGVVCIGVVDVDNDGDIDAADGQEILRYHVVTEVMNGTYSGNVGTTGYLYATKIVGLARTSNGN